MSSNQALLRDTEEFHGIDALGAAYWQTPSTSIAAVEFDQKEFSWHNQIHKEDYCPPQLVVKVDGQAPPWIQQTVDKLSSFTLLPKNWDSYGADRISLKSIATCIQLMGSVMTEATTVPEIVPATSGGLQLEWHLAGIDLEVEISPDGSVSVYFVDVNDPEGEWEAELGYLENADLALLNQSLAEILRRAA